MNNQEFVIKRENLIIKSDGEIDTTRSNLPWIKKNDEKVTVNTNILAKYLHSGKYEDTGENIIDYLITGSKSVFIYEDGKYVLTTTESFRGFICRFIPSECRCEKTKKELYNELMETSPKWRKCNFSDFNIGINKYINFKDGLLNLETRELEPHNPKVKSTVQLDYNYKDVVESCGESEVFDRYMSDLCDGKDDYKEVLMQFLGVIISNIPGETLKMGLFMHGDGNTGKSQLRALAEHLIGKGNSVAVQLSDLEENSVARSSIYGKRLIGSGEMKQEMLKGLDTFKALTGGDSIYGNPKYKDSFSFIYHGLVWYNSNNMPRFGGDKGNWVYDRLAILSFKNVIPDEKKDKYILDKMKKESCGIIYKTLEALYRFLENGSKIILPQECLELREKCKTDNSSALQFVAECCIESISGDKEKTKRSYFYREYKSWCYINGYVAKSKVSLFQELENIYASAEKSFFCCIKGEYYVRNYKINTAKMEELRNPDISNNFVSDDVAYEIENGSEALKNKKIIEIEKAKVESDRRKKEDMAEKLNTITGKSLEVEEWFNSIK